MKDDILYGINPVREALRGGREAFELFVAGDESERRLAKLLELAAEHGVPVRRRDKRDLARLSGTDHHQGVVLRVAPFAYAELEDVIDRWRASGEPGLVLLLDSIQDPHNLGALIRTAACAGAHGVVIPQDRAVGVTPAVEKASAGAVETVPVARVTNLAHAIDQLKEAGFWVFGTASGEGESIYGHDLSGNVTLVIGSEGEGIRPLVAKKCDVLVTIPLKGGVSSLNASVAGGIVLFEIVRQRLAGGK
ncbi:MAG TPA: 23S rRNA (guanosine(2251)-2'-O)-methyltransferase RlmB [Geobacteraceae bacterium]